MSGHPVYYPWQGRAPQPPSPPTHSFNPWRPRARKLRLPPTPSRRAAPRARQRLSPGLGARQGSGGSTAGLGGSAGPPPPELAPQAPGARRAGPAPGRRRPLLSRAAAGSPRLQVLGSRRTARLGTELPRCRREKAGLPPAHGRRFRAAGQRRRALPGESRPTSLVLRQPARPGSFREIGRKCWPRIFRWLVHRGEGTEHLLKVFMTKFYG